MIVIKVVGFMFGLMIFSLLGFVFFHHFVHNGVLAVICTVLAFAAIGWYKTLKARREEQGQAQMEAAIEETRRLRAEAEQEDAAYAYHRALEQAARESKLSTPVQAVEAFPGDRVDLDS